jgi:hypothetical protein
MKLPTTKNAGKLLVILITMWMHWYNADRISNGAHPGLYTRSHWMPPSGECQHCIAPVAAKVINFGCKHKSLTKHNF